MISIKRSFQGGLGAIKTVGFVEDLIEIWLNEVCDSPFTFTPPLRLLQPKAIVLDLKRASKSI